MKKALIIFLAISLLSGCVASGKKLPEVSGSPEPINTHEVMNDVQK
ncbi:conjugal transfer protein [Pantoea stewartii]|nr:conjugal transfer protein [Pantoea stewartii]